MRYRNAYRAVILALMLQISFSSHRIAVSGEDLTWQTIASGIQYREFSISGPNHIYVARMDRVNPQVTLESSIAQGRLSGGLETVREMAARYDQSISYWGDEWGGRNQVVAAINGFFYDCFGVSFRHERGDIKA